MPTTPRKSKPQSSAVTPRSRLVAHIGFAGDLNGGVSSPTGYEVTEVIHPDGLATLHCQCSMFQKHKWCKHMEYVVINEIDGTDLQKERHDLPQLVAVPLFKKPRLFAKVGVDAADPSNPIRKCGIVIEKTSPVNDSTAPRLECDFIGFITHGQGRNSLRRMAMEWLMELSIMPDKVPACTSPHHYEDVPLNPDIRDKRAMCNLYSVVTTGWCYTCHESNGVPDI